MSYDEVAEIYDRAYAGAEFRREDRLVARALRKLVPDGSNVLDVGCGTGKAIELLPDSVDYVGLDISERMLAVARRAFPDRAFVHGDARSVPFQDETFDVVVSTFGALSHVLEIEDALAEITRVLRPGGRTFLMVYGLDRQATPRRRRSEVVAYSPRGAAIPSAFTVDARLYSAADFRKLMRPYFECVRIRGLTLRRQPARGKSVSLSSIDNFLDKMLCLIHKDHAHTLLVRARRSRRKLGDKENRL